MKSRNAQKDSHKQTDKDGKHLLPCILSSSACEWSVCLKCVWKSNYLDVEQGGGKVWQKQTTQVHGKSRILEHKYVREPICCTALRVQRLWGPLSISFTDWRIFKNSELTLPFRFSLVWSVNCWKFTRQLKKKKTKQKKDTLQTAAMLRCDTKILMKSNRWVVWWHSFSTPLQHTHRLYAHISQSCWRVKNHIAQYS